MPLGSAVASDAYVEWPSPGMAIQPTLRAPQGVCAGWRRWLCCGRCGVAHNGVRSRKAPLSELGCRHIHVCLVIDPLRALCLAISVRGRGRLWP